MKKLTTEEFIEKSQKIHENKYDYSKCIYKGSHTKVCIICPEHGEFWQTGNHHMNGYNCKKCSIKITTQKITHNINKFIEKSQKIHEDKYDYSKTVYINDYTKVCIICSEHGEFWQTPGSHINKGSHGCPKCGFNSIKNKKLLTTEEFIEKSQKIHEDKYDYSKVEYINSKEKVCIICPEHGEFWQIAQNHINGRGCPICKQSSIEKEIIKILENKNIKFIYNYRGFGWLKNIKPLELDFYLPDYNIAIECQGIQHFKPNNYFGGKYGLQYIQNNDKLKKELCDKNGVKLYYVNYHDNIEEKTNYIIDSINKI